MTTQLQASELPTIPNPRSAPVSPANGKAPSVARDPELTDEIRALLRERFEGSSTPPPGVVEEVLRDLVRAKRHDLLLQAAREGLVAFAWDCVKHNQINNPRRAANASGKWNDAAESARSHPDIFGVWVETAAGRKLLGDCGKADLAFAAERRETQAATMLDNAERFRKLARKLKADQVVRDLGREVVEGVFNA